jgi:ferredoxin
VGAVFGLDQLLKVLDPDPVLVDQKACLRARHARSACKACSHACPEAAIQIQGRQVSIIADKCNRCGLCVSACSTAAVRLRGVDDTAVLKSARVRCSRAGGEGAVLPCLGLLTPDHLIAMSLAHGETTLVTDDCEACPMAKGRRAAEAAVQGAEAALRSLGKQPSIHIRKNTEPTQVVSRRELLTLWRTEGAQVAGQLLPEAGVRPNAMPSQVPKRRGAWIGQLPADTVPADNLMPDGGPWSARTVTEACTGCATCVLFCPTGALTQQREASSWHLFHQAAACVNCNTCVELCPEEAIATHSPSAQAMASGETRQLITLTK